MFLFFFILFINISFQIPVQLTSNEKYTHVKIPLRDNHTNIPKKIKVTEQLHPIFLDSTKAQHKKASLFYWKYQTPSEKMFRLFRILNIQ